MRGTTRVLFKVLGIIAGVAGVAVFFVHASRAAESGGPPAKPEATFEIKEFRVLGAVVLPRIAIERAVYPYLGADRTINTVKEAADALEKAYKDAGYGAVYVDIPEQEVADGIVRLKVTEGTLESVHVRGERYYSRRQILAALPALEPGRHPPFRRCKRNWHSSTRGRPIEW